MLLMLFLTGCVDQQKEVNTYRAVIDGEHPAIVAEPAAAQTLTLEWALRLANRRNEQLASKGEDYLQSLIARNKAAAAFLPTISLGPTYSIEDNRGGSSAFTVGTGASSTTVLFGQSGSTIHQLTVPASADINLFNGFRDAATLKGAGFTAEQRKALLLDQQATLLLNVAQTYYAILKSEKSADVLANSLTYQAERVRDTEAKVRLGISRPLDLAQSRSDLAGTKVSLTQAHTDVRNGRATLAFMIGIPVVDGPLSDRYIVPAGVDNLDAYLQAGQFNRQDLLAACHAEQAAKQNVTAAVGEYFPSVQFDPSYILAQSPGGGPLWSLLFSANVPIFSAGKIEADVRTAWSVFRQAALAESNVRRQVVQDVRTSYEDFTGSTQKLKDLRDEVAAADDALKLSDRSYQLGSATNLERLSSLDTLLNAQLQLASEQFNQKLYYLQLLRMTGLLTTESPTVPVAYPATAPTSVPVTNPTTAPATRANPEN
ncbi:MAG TPA: TolC family protein [Tepidisphaeraceae bacterium]|nr:TolC family protein [Tepidisphaeraceae bacterium]